MLSGREAGGSGINPDARLPVGADPTCPLSRDTGHKLSSTGLVSAVKWGSLDKREGGRVREDENDNLILDDGTEIPAAERTSCEVYSRVCGFLRPVESWNVGKQEEFRDRKIYQTAQAVGCGCGAAASADGSGTPQGQADEAGAQPTS